VLSSPSCECFRTVARTVWSLCILSTYTLVRPEFLPQPLDTTRIRAQLRRSPESRRCFSTALWQPVRTASAVAANKMVSRLGGFATGRQPSQAISPLFEIALVFARTRAERKAAG
jgi:hypothetical protein